jgi:hypothetical protein
MFTEQKVLYEWWSEFLLCFVSNGKPIILNRASILQFCKYICTL